VRAADSVAGQVPSFTATGLPPGVSVSTAGQVTGWPTRPGSYQVTVTGRDSLQATGTAGFGWTVSLAADSGPAGTVRSALAGDCLEDVGNRSASGTQAGLWPCNGSSAQHWTSVQDGTLRIHGMCLTVPGSRPASGSKVKLASCSGAARQQWQPEYPRAISASLGASPTTLINPWSRMCLTVPARATGTRAVIRRCAGSAAQSWTLPAGSVRLEVPGKCLDDSGGRTASGNKIDISACAGTVAQRWTLAPDGTLRVRGRCLGLNRQGRASGTPAGLYACNGTGSQLWHLIPAGSGLMLVNPRSGRCLSDPNAVTVNGTRLVIEPCAATPGKVWRPA
ncbi:MAG TPA: ricin-type beta-trefoil lectin domain protein, partial [Streptosporangiaceae bacterium]|nr:ricin-type beta-trefoil lectin domain protein [Streptosporangiaceae bacterium]